MASLAKLSIWLRELTSLLTVCAATAAPPVRLSTLKFSRPIFIPLAAKEPPLPLLIPARLLMPTSAPSVPASAPTPAPPSAAPPAAAIFGSNSALILACPASLLTGSDSTIFL